ncbi:LPS export ABC transporter periplasmic protein LptC [Poseidonocella pacifica]|nr:LPS export ABC transporter periplasmic protein LptC [Poseidonocella pacifica]
MRTRLHATQSRTQPLSGYSRFVAWAKILLPLASLALLSTVFLVARQADPAKSIPFAKTDVEALAREPRVTAPLYAAVTRDGATITVSADTATPDPASEDQATARKVWARIQTSEGIEYNAVAEEGRIEGNEIAILRGNVDITTSLGYRLRTEEMTAELGMTRLTTRAEVDADGPLGEINAGRMEVRTEDVTNASVMVFKDGVRLIYRPSSTDDR